jgi:hypothetical protein
METRTLEALRALAKAKGLKGYNRLRKDELLRRLAKAQSAPVKPAAKSKTRAAGKKTSSAKAAPTTRKKPPSAATRASGIPPARPPAAPVATPSPGTARASGDEERVENAKFAMAPPGVAVIEPAFDTDLGEDIERLPAITEPVLCLLPQKPGVLLGYWRLPSEIFTARHPLKLRLGRLQGETPEIFEEVPLPQAHGHWYFHLRDTVDTGSVYLQLGHYEPDGKFISAFRRAMARIPSLYASEQIDRQWWVSATRFRTMYLSAGGHIQGARLGWSASISSRSK